ncbi:MAG: hypothetical protein EBR10_04580 [Planctomycetes bacterium]|nr:hypothetical protein [Planctomycetota bacterium]
MRFHALQTSPLWERISENRAAISAALDARQPAPGDLVVLPELCETGFTMRADLAAARDSVEWMGHLAKQHRIFLQAGIARRMDGGIANTATVFAPSGEEIGCYRKVFLFTPGGEHRAYVSGDRPVVVDCGGVRIAPMICYDLRFPELFRHALLGGAEVFTFSACWPAARLHQKRAMLIARALENQAAVVACNRSGSEPTIVYSGGSVMLDHVGNELASLAGEADAMLTAEVDIDALRAFRSSFPVASDIRRSLLGL